MICYIKFFLRNKIILIFCIGLFYTARGQVYQLATEYKAIPELRNILVKPDSSNLIPDCYLYSNCLKNADESEKVIVSWDNIKNVVVSPDNKYLGLISLLDKPKNPTERQVLTFTTFNAIGEKIYSVKSSFINDDGIPQFVFSESKNVLAIVSQFGEHIKFYNNRGKMIREKLLSPGIKHSYRNPKGVFSNDGNYFLFNITGINNTSDKSQPDLFMLSSIGEQIWTYQLPVHHAKTIGISDNGKYSIVSGPPSFPESHQPEFQTVLLNNEGKLIEIYPFGFKYYDFDDSKSWLLLADEYILRLIRLSDGSVYFSKALGRDRTVISDIAILSNGEIAVAIGVESYKDDHVIYNHPAVTVYSYDGDILFHYGFDGDYTCYGKILVSKSGSQIGITLQNRFVTFQKVE